MARGTRRDLKKEAFWRRMLRGRGQARSGLSVRAWYGRHAVRESAFYWCRTRLTTRDAAAPRFVSVAVTTEPASAARPGRIEIVLPGERRVHVVGPVDRQALTDVLAVLAEGARTARARGC